MKNQNIEDFYPLTPLQSGMLFHSLADYNDGMYIEQFRCVISGELNFDYFKLAWQELIDKYQVLRTSFLIQIQA